MQRVLGICLQMIESRHNEEILFCHTTGHPASNAGNGSSA